ncbi:MAG: glycosyltransferase family 25 protein [Candidatus Paceibacterota bacterium]
MNNISLFRISIMSLRRPNKSIPSAIQHKLKENNRHRLNSIFPLVKIDNNVNKDNKDNKNKLNNVEENKENENKENENKENKENENKENENENKENKNKENGNKENGNKENENKENEGEENENKENGNKEISRNFESNNQQNISANISVLNIDESQIDLAKIHERHLDSKMEVSRVGKVCGIWGVEKIYCINLQSCKERKDHMKKEFLKNNFNATFVNAIHPKHTEHKRKYTNPNFVDQGWIQTRCYCTQQDCGHRPRKLRSTEVAISLSHNNIYMNIVNNNIKWSLVCEDDLIFANNFCNIVNSLVPPEIWNHQFYKLPDDPDTDNNIIIQPESASERPIIIFLGGARDNMGLEKTNVSQFKLKRMPNGVYSNYCYLINLEAAKFFSRKFYPITRPEDSFKRYWISKGRIDCYRVNPSIIAELSAGTNMPSIYNRWSLGKVAPGTAGEPSKEYKPVEKNSTGAAATTKKTRRKINYKKFTKLSNTPSK